MKKRSFVALLAAVPAVAYAQMGGRRRGGENGAKGGGRAGGPEPQINAMESALHEFEEDLKLTGAQQNAWTAYAEGLRALQKDVARERAPRGAEMQLELPKRLDRVADVARDRLTAVEDIVDSAKALFKLLSPEQQAVADPRLANLIGLSFGATCAPAAARPPQKPAPQAVPPAPPA